MEKIYITSEVIDYINHNKGAFNDVMPEVNDEWVVKRVITYPCVNYGEPVIEVEKEGAWMRLPADMFYSKSYSNYLSEKYTKSNK